MSLQFAQRKQSDGGGERLARTVCRKSWPSANFGILDLFVEAKVDYLYANDFSMPLAICVVQLQINLQSHSHHRQQPAFRFVCHHEPRWLSINLFHWKRNFDSTPTHNWREKNKQNKSIGNNSFCFIWHENDDDDAHKFISLLALDVVCGSAASHKCGESKLVPTTLSATSNEQKQ